jgi:hypothetical protein
MLAFHVECHSFKITQGSNVGFSGCLHFYQVSQSQNFVALYQALTGVTLQVPSANHHHHDGDNNDHHDYHQEQYGNNPTHWWIPIFALARETWTIPVVIIINSSDTNKNNEHFSEI